MSQVVKGINTTSFPGLFPFELGAAPIQKGKALGRRLGLTDRNHNNKISKIHFHLSIASLFSEARTGSATFHMKMSSHANKTHYHMNRFASGVALITRLKASRN